ncbi:hypothetical protein EIN_457830 [Entamoeba invadens IP1]|uniref:ShKT domain-containing protein n=1 Tax=Entamoeba invadens IP1 TaxID=370355 RepID=A0A0A1U5D4_ENTIV|nr:hypothetical protein EIN_457830 [Entamoeba invadens IP1]ELP89524.1 hypothetical protein EIN_457830 [Entamoeba invadens IP1]|eukprot:XP_004256295.1 hypothetical protein EIN_457830 [Entamoeba invadens IP1]
MFSVITTLLVILSNGVYLQSSETLVDPLCMTDLVVVNMNSSSVNVRDYTICYDKIQDYEHKVYGYDIQSLCFVHPDFFIVNKSTLFLNRCGEWLQIVGPSENVVNCMIAGSADISTEGSTFAIERRTIGVYSSLYKRLTSGVDNVNNYLTQVSVFEVAFDLGIPVSLYVINRTQSTVAFQFIDHNKPAEKIGIEYKNVVTSYRKNIDDTFVIPLINDYVNVQMVSFDDEKIRFLAVNFSKIDMATAAVRYVAVNTKPCKYIADTQVFDSSKVVEDKLIFQKWQVWTINEKQEGRMFEWGNNNVSFVAEGGNLTLCFAYANAFRIQKDFKEMKVVFDVDGDYEFLITHVLHDTSLTTLNLSTISLIQANLPTQYLRVNGGKTIEMKIAFNLKTLQFSNVITITQKFSKGAHVVLKNSDKCNSTSLDCLFTECSITNESYYTGPSPFLKGCEPFCGVCRDGFVCSSQGFCIKEPSNNNRDGGSIVTIIVFIFVLIVVL